MKTRSSKCKELILYYFNRILTSCCCYDSIAYIFENIFIIIEQFQYSCRLDHPIYTFQLLMFVCGPPILFQDFYNLFCYTQHEDGLRYNIYIDRGLLLFSFEKLRILLVLSNLRSTVCNRNRKFYKISLEHYVFSLQFSAQSVNFTISYEFIYKEPTKS